MQVNAGRAIRSKWLGGASHGLLPPSTFLRANLAMGYNKKHPPARILNTRGREKGVLGSARAHRLPRGFILRRMAWPQGERERGSAHKELTCLPVTSSCADGSSTTRRASVEGLLVIRDDPNRHSSLGAGLQGTHQCFVCHTVDAQIDGETGGGDEPQEKKASRTVGLGRRQRRCTASSIEPVAWSRATRTSASLAVVSRGDATEGAPSIRAPGGEMPFAAEAVAQPAREAAAAAGWPIAAARRQMVARMAAACGAETGGRSCRNRSK
eukprot:scaffold16939_cov101-Isochrysis_galbana.AAC.2